MADPKVKMGRISYINALPVYYGLNHTGPPSWLEMVTDVPAALNHKLMQGDIQISPISSAFYAMNHEDLLLLPDLSISCHGKVLSVILASNYPIAELDGKTVIFSKESASSSAFLKMIFQKQGIHPNYQVADVSRFEGDTLAADAVLVIGDSSLIHPWDRSFSFVFDLGQLWYEMTKMPLVFAVWAVRKDFANDCPDRVAKVCDLLYASRKLGLENQEWIVKEGQRRLGISAELSRRYFDLLLCDLDPPKVAAMQLFFDSLFQQGVLPEKSQIAFFN